MNPEQIAQLWNLGQVTSLTALAGGSINGAYRVQSESGTFHLRVYRDRDARRAELELAAIQVALQAGVPTPRPQASVGGGLLAQLEGQWAALFALAPGAPIPRDLLTAGDAASLGAFLAALHQQLPEKVRFEVPAVRSASVEGTLARLESVILALPERDELDSWALERTRQRLAHLRASPLPDQPPAYPSRFLHGDYHDGNVFFSAGQAVALTDWEQTRLAPRAWEVVRLLHFSFGLRPELCLGCLKAYRDVSPLSAEELQDGARFYALTQERNVWVYESVYLYGNTAPRAFIHPPPYVPFQVQWAEAGLL